MGNHRQPIIDSCRVWFPAVLMLLVTWLAGPQFLQGQSSSDFRDLGRTPSPQELFRKLGKHRPPLSDTAMFDELQKLGRDIFENLSPEQQQSAKQYAEQLIRDKGIDSPEVSSLMDRMGVPPNVRQKLADKIQTGELTGQSSRRSSPSGTAAESLREFSATNEKYQQLLQEIDQTDEFSEKVKKLQSMQELLNSQETNLQNLNQGSSSTSNNRQLTRESSPDQSSNPTTASDKRWAESFYKAAKEALPEIQKSIAQGDISPEQAASTLDRLKSAVRQLNSQSENDNASLKSLFQNGSKLLKKVDQNGNLKEKIEARFDRLLLDAAKSSVESAAENGDSTFMQKTIDSLMTSAVDLAKDQTKNKPKSALDAILGRDKSKPRNSSRRQLEQINNEFVNNQNGNNRSNPQSSDSNDSTSSSANDQADPIPGFDDASNGTSWLWLLGCIALAAAGYAVFKKLNSPADPVAAKKKQLAKALQSKTMRTPTGLVEAVDLYLVTEHGAQARWWNEALAQEAVVQQQPELRDRIAQLFQTYSVSRYQPDNRLQQQQCSDAESALRSLVSTHHAVAKPDSPQSTDRSSEGSEV